MPLWHRDRDDLTELKLFFYATDVDISSGPHAYLPKTHNQKGLKAVFPTASLDNPVINGTKNSFVDDSFFIAQGFNSSFKKWLGPAGTCFLEDTRGFHQTYIQPTHLACSLVSLTIGPGY